MPQTHDLHSRIPIQIAQDNPTEANPARVPGGENPATTAGKGEAHQAGEIPDAGLLFSNAILVALIMLIFALVGRKRLTAVPKGFSNFAEFVVEALNTFTVGIIGHGGEKYTPLVGTIFLFILFSDLIGLIPGFHAPTTNMTITFALGIIVFVYVQYQGIRANGLGGYIRHFMGPMPLMAPLIMPVEIISEIIKPFTLAVRLFGNIFGEDVIIFVLAGLGAASVATMWIPLQLPILFLAVLTDVVQAMVFAILTCIYISLMVHHDTGEQGEQIGPAHEHAAGH
ncbi:MAG TPA: F0F1 ATP synthase subunit A [Chthonomonadaceae bacterium]|nr:F0F1 ATP synthase subunit A [Chthonomonadaceae bacterium]